MSATAGIPKLGILPVGANDLGGRTAQLYLVPNTVATLRAFEPVLRALGRA